MNISESPTLPQFFEKNVFCDPLLSSINSIRSDEKVPKKDVNHFWA